MCSLAKTEDPGSILGVNLNCLSLLTNSPLSSLQHLSWASGFSSLISFRSCFYFLSVPEQFASLTPNIIPSVSFSVEILGKLHKVIKWSFCLYSLSSCNQVISMELVLCISSGGKHLDLEFKFEGRSVDFYYCTHRTIKAY